MRDFKGKREKERERERVTEEKLFCYCVLWHGLWGELLWCAWRGKWLCGSNRNHGCEQDCCAFVTTFSSDVVRTHDYDPPCSKHFARGGKEKVKLKKRKKLKASPTVNIGASC